MRRIYWSTGIVIALLVYSCSGGRGGSAADRIALVFTSAASVTVAENRTGVLRVRTSDADAELGLDGTDAARFELRENGVLLFLTAPDYENPSDADADNVFEISVHATDAAGIGVTQELRVTVTDVEERLPDTLAPEFTSAASASVAENTTAVLRVTADDADAVLRLGGTDAALFELRDSGGLFFKRAPDYEHPSDADGDNEYALRVTAADAAGNAAMQELSVTVTDAEELPVVPVTVLKTGQLQSCDEHGNEVFDGSVKDDGYYRKGADRSYTRDALNNTVTDSVTGLMWQDDVAIVTRPWVSDAGYAEGRYGDTSGDTAAAYCEGLEYGGYADWRLPTLSELKSLVDYSRHDPPTNPVFENVLWSSYWSATTYDVLPESAWTVSFDGGESRLSVKINSNYVRCVRAGELSAP
jgi:hypothetical protein